MLNGLTLGTTAELPESTIQATVNIHLDKDTPREYWDRVLALLGEKRKVESEEQKPSDQLT